MMNKIERRALKRLIPLVVLALSIVGVAPQAVAANKRDVTVMSRNMYLGASLTPALGATTLGELVTAASVIWANVQTNDIEARAEAMADEIAASRPGLIAIQEASLWRTDTPADGDATPAEFVVYDYLEILDEALKARGLNYRVVRALENFDGELPTAFGHDVRLTDRVAVLADASLPASELKISNVQAAHFSPGATLTIPTRLIGDVSVLRGWVSMNVKLRGKTFRFVATHLEAFHPGIAALQAGELLTGPANTSMPVAMAGDFNSAPTSPLPSAYGILMGPGGFTDAWSELHPASPGFTCCFGEVLTNPADSLNTRIDLVIHRGPWDELDSEVVGDEPDDFFGLWPSDHAGVVTSLKLKLPR